MSKNVPRKKEVKAKIAFCEWCQRKKYFTNKNEIMRLERLKKSDKVERFFQKEKKYEVIFLIIKNENEENLISCRVTRIK